MDEIIETINKYLDFALKGKTLKKFVKLYKKFYDELQKEGFTKGEALTVITSFGLGAATFDTQKIIEKKVSQRSSPEDPGPGRQPPAAADCATNLDKTPKTGPSNT